MLSACKLLPRQSPWLYGISCRSIIFAHTNQMHASLHFVFRLWRRFWGISWSLWLSWCHWRWDCSLHCWCLLQLVNLIQHTSQDDSCSVCYSSWLILHASVRHFITLVIKSAFGARHLQVWWLFRMIPEYNIVHLVSPCSLCWDTATHCLFSQEHHRAV